MLRYVSMQVIQLQRELEEARHTLDVALAERDAVSKQLDEMLHANSLQQTEVADLMRKAQTLDDLEEEVMVLRAKVMGGGLLLWLLD